MYIILHSHLLYFFFFFNDTATTEIYTLSLHDALPISDDGRDGRSPGAGGGRGDALGRGKSGRAQDRKSTRLNSSHSQISYAVFCLKKKKYPTAQILLRNCSTGFGNLPLCTV